MTIPNLFSTTPAKVTTGSNGIGVKNTFDSGTDNGQLDNKDAIDFIILELPGDEWVPVSMQFTKINENGNDDVRIIGLNSFDTDIDGIDDVVDPLFFGSVPLDGLIEFNTADTFEFILVVGQILLSDNDNYRIASFSGDQIVPEPGAIALLGMGLLGLGIVRRRRITA